MPRPLRTLLLLDTVALVLGVLCSPLAQAQQQAQAQAQALAEAQAQALCMLTQDYNRAYEAFVQRQKPVFKGN